MKEYYYRVEFDSRISTPEGPKIRLRCTQYPVMKHTLKGVKLGLGFGESRFVSNTSRKRLAYPSKEEAIAGYLESLKGVLARQRSQVQHTEIVLDAVQSDAAKIFNPTDESD